MGTDIHPVIEIKQPNGEWEPFARLAYFGRDYWLFQVLGGTMTAREWNDTLNIGRRGLEFKEKSARWYSADDYGDHSHSWATAEELEKAQLIYATWAYPGQKPGQNAELGAAISALRGLASAGFDARLAWGYDS